MTVMRKEARMALAEDAGAAPNSGPRPLPRQDRSQKTYERLLDVTSGLLAEVGIEGISTNMICARAGMTTPALYRYFKDKFAIVEALAERLMDRQFDVVQAWLVRHLLGGVPALSGNMEEVIRALAGVTAAEPGAIWVIRALRATPRLTHVRLNSHRRVTDELCRIYGPLMPQVPPDMLWMRTRIAVEYAYATDEMIAESNEAGRDQLFYEAGRILGSLFYFQEHPRG
jgi:AcrR family transcriptional regulator